MSKVKVLFFAADPLSAPADGRTPRLLLDEDVRQIRQKVRAAEHRDALEFDVRWAARTDDLLQALNETRPQVVHFSGHGQNEGLVLVSVDGRRPHVVPALALEQLFEVFRGDIRLVMLNACFSLPQAEAIAASVGCAIGTRGPISDEGAITFGGAFYRAVAFGQSVQAAYDQARTALALEHVDDQACPQLVVRPGVDPARLVLIPPGGAEAGRRGLGRAEMTVAGLAIAGAAVVASVMLGDRTSGAPGPQGGDSTLVEATRAQAGTLPAPESIPAAAPAGEPVTQSHGRRTQPARDPVTQSDDRRTQPDKGRRQPDVAAQPDEGRRQPDVATQPDDRSRQPNVATQPDDRRRQPDVTTQPDDRRRQPNVVTQPVDAGQQTVETVESVLDASPVRKLPGTLNTVPLLGDTARDRIVPPVRPR